MNHLYARLVENTKIHITPEEGYLKFNFFRKGKPKQDIWVLNHTGCRMLTYCDGTRSIDEICKIVFGEDVGDIDQSAIHGFFYDAVGMGHIELRDQPDKIEEPYVVGRPDCFVPMHISVELTANCNLKCTYCYNDFDEHGVENSELTTDELISVLKEWVALGLSGIELTGGEPLLYPGFWDIMDFCYENLSIIALLSNGIALDDEVADKLLNYRDKLMVSISIDGSCPEYHDQTRGKGSFALTSQAIRRLADRKIQTRAAFSMTPENWMDLEAAIEHAKGLGADFFSYAPIAPFGRAEESGWQWDATQTEEIAKVEQRAMEKHVGFLTTVSDEMRESLDKAGNCGAGYKNVTLSPTGKIRACSFMPENRFLGDIRKKSLLEIFSKSTMQYLHDLRYPDEDTCHECRYLTYCGNCWIRPLSVMKHEGRVCKWAAQTGIIDALGFDDLSDLLPGSEVFPWTL